MRPFKHQYSLERQTNSDHVLEGYVSLERGTLVTHLIEYRHEYDDA